MKIKSISSFKQAFKLNRHYAISYKTLQNVDNVIVEILTEDGKLGLGAGSPASFVTKETIENSLHALNKVQEKWIGREVSDFSLIKREINQALSSTPAACAALDIALHDLYAQCVEKPLVKVLGQAHHALPTSITIGIKNVEETLKEAKEYIERGFHILKVKLGNSLEEDIARLSKLRENYSNDIIIRVDPNQGYTISELKTFFDKTKKLSIEFMEQPLKVQDTQLLHELSQDQKKHIALDESVLNAHDAIQRLMPSPCCGIFNIKLMKCGGIHSAMQIAIIAEAAKIDLMWGCNDESIISITAALHTAFSSPMTKYIDLDGSLDLSHDYVSGGFKLHNGVMSTLDLPGLGVKKI